MNLKPNVVILLTDCLRWDYFNNMKIKKEVDLVLENAYSPAPSTFFAVPSLITGTFPFEVINDSIIPREFPFYLPRILEDFGYNNIFITGNIVTSRYFGYKQGEIKFYEDFIYKKEQDVKIVEHILNTRSKPKVEKLRDKLKEFLKSKAPAVATFLKKGVRAYRDLRRTINLFGEFNDQNSSYQAKVRGEEIIASFEDALNEISKRPVFAFLHLMDTHSPYGPPDLGNKTLAKYEKTMRKLNYAPSKLTEAEKKIIKELYTKEVHYLDKNLKKLLNLIWNKLGYDNTLVVILSDHGELLGENGLFTHPGFVLARELLHIPIALSGGPLKKIILRRNALLSSIFVYYFILNLVTNRQTSLLDMQEILSVGYKRDKLYEYHPFNLFYKTNSKEAIYILEHSPEIYSKFNALLQRRRRRILTAKIRKIEKKFWLPDIGPLHL